MKPYDAIRIETDRNIIANKTRICAVRFLLGAETVQVYYPKCTLEPGDVLTIKDISGQVHEALTLTPEPINEDYYGKE